MKPLTPRPTLLVDPWGFRIADPDGNVLGKEDSIYVTDPVTGSKSIVVPPGIERLVRSQGLEG